MTTGLLQYQDDDRKDFKSSMYHKVLRVAVSVMAVVLVFESGLLSESTAQLSQNTHQYLANAVGMTVGVESTELNQFTAALTQKNQELREREEVLAEREIAVELSAGASSPGNQRATYILAGVLFILLTLILLNYVLDYLRWRREAHA